MSLLVLFLKAYAFGVAVAAPVGPMCILCMRRTLIQGWRFGLVTALGIACSDALYSAVAAFGLTNISDFVMQHKPSFHLLAATFLLCFGIKIYLTKTLPKVAAVENATISLPYAFSSAMLMTMTNPLTLMFFITVFTALTPESGYNHLSSTLTILGVFSGSLSWTSGIVVSVSFFRHVMSESKQLLIDKITGIFLFLCGLTEIWRYFS